MLELIETTDAGLVAVLKNDTHASKWIREGKQFFHDETVTKRIMPLIQPGWTCVDVGANLGTFTVAMAKVATRVIAFEPVLTTWVCLMVNASKFANVTCHYGALGSRIGRAYLSDDVNAGANHMLADYEHGCHCAKMDRLDAVIARGDRVDFIKLDCEGYEPEVLRGGMDTIRAHRPIIFCEINRGALARYGFTAEEIVRPLYNMGYRMEFLDPEHNLAMEQVDVFLMPSKEELP